MSYEKLLDRFVGYAKINTRSDADSTSVPSTPSQVEFAQRLRDEMTAIGLTDVHYLPDNGYVIGTIPATTQQPTKRVGFISHMDTADFNADGINPQIIESYDGGVIKLGSSDVVLDPADFPNLLNYVGQTLVTTDGTTLLGSDDKSGLAAIMTMAEYLLVHPEIEHGEIRVGFGPDEEIGTGADRFDVTDFDVDFAFTVDGGPLGELQYESFSAAQAVVDIQGKNVHPGTAKNQMVNALQLAIDFHDALPAGDRPEATEGREGFFHLLSLTGVPESAQMKYIIRDFDDVSFAARKQMMLDIAASINDACGQPRVVVTLHDQYHNMRQALEPHMWVIDLAKEAMAQAGVTPLITPVRGGTDGSKISFMGLPTPNLFAGGENMHGRYEYVSLQSMEKAVDVLLAIVRLTTARGADHLL